MEEDTQQYIEKREEAITKLTKSIAENLVGFDALIDGPFESHRQTYVDYAASGKAVKFIEDYIANEVLVISLEADSSLGGADAIEVDLNGFTGCVTVEKA